MILYIHDEMVGVCVCVFICVQLFVTPLTVACQSPLSMGLSRQEYWSGLPFPPLDSLPSPGFEPTSPTSPALTGRFFTTEIPRKPGEMVAVDNSQR